MRSASQGQVSATQVTQFEAGNMVGALCQLRAGKMAQQVKVLANMSGNLNLIPLHHRDVVEGES